MSFCTTTGARWPSRLAFCAAFIFTLASGGINLIYGWQKGGDLPNSLVWASVSLSASIVFALSWPALIRCCDSRSWSRAAIVLVALLVTGSYSISAALGSAVGGRQNADSVEKTASGDRKRAQAAYDTAEQELAKLAPTRPLVELEALTRTARPGCRVHVMNGVRRTVCTKQPAPEVELARARQRAKLRATMDKASSELTKVGAIRVANSDALALADYLGAVGWPISADFVNRVLALLAVLTIECGGGLALAVGMSLSGTGGRDPDTEVSTERTSPPNTRARDPDTLASKPISQHRDVSTCPGTSGQLRPDTIDMDAAGVRFLTFLAGRGGVLIGGQREMGRSLGWSKSWTHEVLHDLAKARLVDLTTGKTGTIVRLAA